MVGTTLINGRFFLQVSDLLNRLNTLVIVFATIVPIAAQTHVDAGFANLIRTPADLQSEVDHQRLRALVANRESVPAMIDRGELAEEPNFEQRHGRKDRSENSTRWEAEVPNYVTEGLRFEG